MLDEISAAVLFLTRLVGRNGGGRLDTNRLAEFGARLSTLLVERFNGHWFPENPYRGQGYRCIRVNEYGCQDPLLERAARDCGLAYEDLQLPVELTIWVDPDEVCCRFGEHKGSYCTVASFLRVAPTSDGGTDAVTSNNDLQITNDNMIESHFPMDCRKSTYPAQRVQVHDVNEQTTFTSPNNSSGHRLPFQFDPSMSYCYLLPRVVHQSVGRLVTGFDTELSPGLIMESGNENENHRRLDYTSFGRLRVVASQSLSTSSSPVTSPSPSPSPTPVPSTFYHHHQQHYHWMEQRSARVLT